MTINPFRCFTSLAAVALLQQSNDWTLTNRAPLVNWPKTGWEWGWAYPVARGMRHATAHSSSYKFDSWKRFRFRFLVFVCPHFSFLVSRFAMFFTFSFDFAIAIACCFFSTVYRYLLLVIYLLSASVRSSAILLSRDAILAASHYCNLLVKYCY